MFPFDVENGYDQPNYFQIARISRTCLLTLFFWFNLMMFMTRTRYTGELVKVVWYEETIARLMDIVRTSPEGTFSTHDDTIISKK